MTIADGSAQPNTLRDAVLLAATGGLLDTVVYLNHGHVFANAMTGNVVLLGISAVGRKWHEIVPHVVPIGGFLAGVWASKWMRSRLGGRTVLLGVGLEIVVLFAMGWLPRGFPEMTFTAVVAFVAAFQVASFRRVDEFSYNSTFLTANLRDVTEGLYDAGESGDVETKNKGFAKARDLGLICVCFLAGAVVGAWCAPRLGNHSLWLAEPLLLIVVVRSVRRRRWG